MIVKALYAEKLYGVDAIPERCNLPEEKGLIDKTLNSDNKSLNNKTGVEFFL